MNYPFWDVDIGYGILMAAISVVHVTVSHFAIGGGLYLVLAESAARKAQDSIRLAYLKKLSKFFVLVTLVFGAVTGVGIWFVIGLLNPAATEVLIHNFVWGWAAEWTFFIMEITAAILYYYGWDRMSARSHLTLGWIYFVAAWMSLFLINGILTFMLTPGGWIETGSFWQGFFNPTMLSSLVFRTGICILLAGLFSLLVASTMESGRSKVATIRYNAWWGLVGLVVMAPSFYWYFQAIPDSIRNLASEMMPFVMARLYDTYWYALPIAVILIVFGLLIPRRHHLVVGLISLALGLAWFGQFEWLRESIRKPYIVYGYMYGNATEVALADDYASDGLLAHLAYRTGDDGADLYRHACRSCHTMNGYKALAPSFDGTDEEFIAGIVRGTGVMVGNMPPWLGTEEESYMIAAHIYPQIDHRHIKDIHGLEGVALGEKVYDIRCGGCHVIGGYGDKTESLVGFEAEDLSDLLDMAGDLGAEMPEFTGDDVEREALILFLMTLQEGGADATAEL